MTTTLHRWREEWAPLASIVHPDPLRPLHFGRKAKSAATGAPPEPVKLARVAGVLYIVDGVRRLVAGAVEVRQDEAGAVQVLAVVADMSAPAMHWEAGRASLEHRDGPRRVETRRAFWAYIKAGMYWNEAGEFRGYDAIGAALGVGKSSVCRWLAQDFPDVAARASATAGARGGARRAKATTGARGGATSAKATAAAVARWSARECEPPTLQQVADRFSVSLTTARRLCASAGVPLRDPTVERQAGVSVEVSAAVPTKQAVKPKAKTAATAKPHPWRALPACGYAGDRRHSASQRQATA